MSTFYADYPVYDNGVASLNGLTGALTLVGANGITITPSGSTITIGSTNTGTVTSVGLADGSTAPIYTITGSPVTSSGTLTFSLHTQSANTVFAGPTTGAAAQPSFRALVAADLPAGTGTVTSVGMTVPTFLSVTPATITTSGVFAITLSGTALPVANGGTGVTSLSNFTDGSAGADGITVTGGTGAVITSTSISQAAATGTQNGYLKSTDWTTFNNKQASGNYITALTGDATASGPGSAALTLAIVNTNIGTFASVTVNGKGLVTAASALSGDATTSGSTLTLATVNTNVGSFTNASITVNAKGLITAASSGTAPVTSISVASANGFAGTSSGGSTPALTLSTTVTGILYGNGTSVAAAVAGNFPTLNQNTTGTAANITATSNSTLTTLSALSLPYSQITGAPAAITALTGDATATGPGSVALTLATVNTNVGSFGSSTSIPSFTVNAKGLITAASGNAVVAPAGTLSGTTLNSTVVSSSLTSVGTITSGTWNGTTIAPTSGGTGLTSYTTGNILYASATNTLSNLAIGSTGNVLTVSGGVPTWAAPATSGTVTSVAASVPSFLSVSGSPITTSGTLAISYSGTALPVANGGTGSTSALTQWGIKYAASTTAEATTAQGAVGAYLTGQGSAAPIFRSPAILKATTASARTMSSSAPTIVYETTVIDTASGYNNTTGVYTIPFTGYYRIGGGFETSGSGTSYGINNLAGLEIKQNGTLGDFTAAARAGSTNSTIILIGNGSTIISCTAGDTIALGGYSDVSTTTATSSAIYNYFEITSI